MSKSARYWRIAGLVGAVGLAVIIAVWWGSRPAATETPATDPSAPATPASAQVEPPHDPFFTKHARTVPAVAPVQAAPVTAVAPVPSNLVTNWEDRIDKILTSETDDPAKAKQMLEMFPRLPEDGQVEVAQHLSNLMPDQDYASLTKLLTNSALPESVLDVLLADALNRPNSIKLPSLLGVARDPQNPKAAEARDLLQLFLDQDYGTDWDTWQTQMDAWLKDNPD